MSTKSLTNVFIAFACLVTLPNLASGKSLLKEPRLVPVITKLVEEYGLDKKQVEATLAQAEFSQPVLDAMSKPAEKTLSWYQYRPIFVTDERALKGAKFWLRHKDLIDRIEIEYGVPGEIIVAILGVETRYGTYEGRHRVLDSLTTLAISDFKRNDFFREELIHFLHLADKEKLDPLSLKGSYAGAMGTPQFIASSYLRYAVDGDGDQQRNLWESMPDIVTSVANYFKVHGWQEGQPIIAGILPGELETRAIDTDTLIRPEQPLSSYLSQKVSWVNQAPQGIGPETKVALLSLQGQNTVEHYLSFQNFYTITRYNHSPLYAMAVFQLAEKVAAQYKDLDS